MNAIACLCYKVALRVEPTFTNKKECYAGMLKIARWREDKNVKFNIIKNKMPQNLSY